MEKEKIQRGEILVVPEDYTLWQSVENRVFDTAMEGHAIYEGKIRITRLSVSAGVAVFTLLFWDTLTLFSTMILAGVVIYVLRFIGSSYRGIYRDRLENFLKEELTLMRDILKRANASKIEVVDVHSSPWFNARYLLRKKY